MDLVINRQVYTLYFGIDFIREIDKKYGHEEQAVPLGMGIIKILGRLKLADIVALSDVIQAATHTLKSQPSARDIEAYLVEADLDDLSNVFLDALESAPVTKKYMQTLTRKVQEVQAEAEKQAEETAQAESLAERPTDE